jgi:hypothetical protein
VKPYRFPVIATAFVAVAWLLWLTPSGSAWQAPVRLALGVAAVVLLPGGALMRALGWFQDSTWRERICLSFGTGFSLMAVLHLIAVILHLSIGQVFAVLNVATIALAFAPSRLEGTNPSARFRVTPTVLLILVALAVFIACGWVLEPPITGEETVELISIRKIAETPFIVLDGIMPEPHAVPTYVITPYYLFVALITKASGVSMFVAYLKLRALYAVLAVLTMASVAARSFPALGERLADAMILGFLALFVADPDPWAWPASMFPLVRRGAVGAGIVAPVMMLALLLFVTTPASRRSRGEWAAPGLMLLALLTTHAMEIIYLGFFGLAALVTSIVNRSSREAFVRLLTFGASAAVVAVGYRFIHARLAAHVYAFDQASQAQALMNLKTELAQGMSSLSGISEAGRYLVSTSGAVVPYTVLGTLCAPLLIRIDRRGGTWLSAAIVIPLVVYSSSKLFALLQLATSSEILYVFGYFTLCGTVALLTLGLVAIDRPVEWLCSRYARSLTPWSIVPVALAVGAAGYVGAAILKYATSVIVANPLALVWVAALGGIVALLVSNRTVASVGGSPFAVIVFAALATGVAFGVRGFPGQLASAREPLLETIARSRATPSVLDWKAYYPVLQAQSNPPIDLPAGVVEDLSALLPPLQILAADPAHSFSLPVVLNQHIVNPGHVISTSLPYFEHYTTLDDEGVRHHPIFNDQPELTDVERKFLKEYGVQYVLVDPPYYDRVGAKLDREAGVFERVYERDRFVLFRCVLGKAGAR